MLRRVAFVRTDVSEQFTESIIMAKIISEIGTTLAVTNAAKECSFILFFLMMEAVRSSKTLFLRRGRRIQEYGYLQMYAFKQSDY
jgi:hypothetical protein